MNTYRLRSGDVVTSKDGTWPTQYTNRTQAQRAADKIPGATMIQRGRPFYVRLCTHNAQTDNNDPAFAWKCADCGYVYGQEGQP
jgi:hypothetical protein